MDTVTKVANVVNPEVMSDIISASLPDEIKFYGLVDVDTTLAARAGDQITLPKWNYIGDAKVVAEGEPIDLTQMSTSTDTAKVEKVATGAALTDEVVLSGFGDPVGEANKQMFMSIAAGVDNKILDAIMKATLTFGAGNWTVETIDNAIAVFNDESDSTGEMVLLLNPKDAGALRKQAGLDWTRATELGDQLLVKGTFGELLGAQVVRSRKIKEGTGYLVKKGALKLYMKRKAEVEAGRDIKTKTTIITGDQHFAAHLYDESKVIKISITKP